MYLLSLNQAQHLVLNLKMLSLVLFYLELPNDILETPKIVLQPRFSFTILIAFIVSIASSCCADTVKDKQSINISCLLIP